MIFHGTYYIHWQVVIEIMDKAIKKLGLEIQYNVVDTDGRTQSNLTYQQVYNTNVTIARPERPTTEEIAANEEASIDTLPMPTEPPATATAAATAAPPAAAATAAAPGTPTDTRTPATLATPQTEHTERNVRRRTL